MILCDNSHTLVNKQDNWDLYEKFLLELNYDVQDEKEWAKLILTEGLEAVYNIVNIISKLQIKVVVDIKQTVENDVLLAGIKHFNNGNNSSTIDILTNMITAKYNPNIFDNYINSDGKTISKNNLLKLKNFITDYIYVIAFSVFTPEFVTRSFNTVLSDYLLSFFNSNFLAEHKDLVNKIQNVDIINFY